MRDMIPRHAQAVRNRNNASREWDPDEAATRHRRDDPEPDAAVRTWALAESEARHRDVAEVASDWFWETDAAHRLILVSTRFAEVACISPDQVVGRPLDRLVVLGFDPTGMVELLATMDARAVFRNVIHRVVLEFRGVRFWRMSGKPFADPATGEFAGYRGTGTDATVTIEREAALNDALLRAEAAEEDASRMRMRLVDAIEAIPEGFVLHDADDRLVLCNSRYGEIYGLSAGQMKPGVSFEAVLRDITRRDIINLDGQGVEGWVAERLEHHHSVGRRHILQRLTNGHWLKVVERHTSDGGIVGIRVDVTEARQREAAEREREKLAALGHLAGSVAHEINNLLQPAITLPELVRDRLPADDAESRDDLDCVVELSLIHI